jgi:hypothetical protein
MLIRFSGTSVPNTTVRSRLQTYALVTAALAAGALLIAFGLVVLAALAVTGTVMGGGIAAYHRLTGRWPRFLHVRTQVWPIGAAGPAGPASHGLDPADEVFPPGPDSPRLPGGPDSTPGA